LFSFPLLLLQIGWRPDVVIAVAPAIAAAPFALLTARLSGAKAWLHLQDFELDAAANLGLLPANSLITNLARRAERGLLARFDRVSTISGRMLERLVQKGVPAERTVLFPNWVDPDSIFPLPAEANPLQAALEIPAGKLIVLYAGNLGRKQGLEVLLEAARLLAGSSEILFMISGEGTMKAQLQAEAGELPNLRFFPLQPIERLNALLNLVDIHVLPQRADAADLVMPSKLLGMLASGRPVLATARPGTELAQVLEGVGLVVPPEDAGALAAGILRLARDPALRARLGAQGRRLCQARWAREKVLGDFARRLSELMGK
jgi:colanic acid biosynthesis glycosyl transferase WcaI